MIAGLVAGLHENPPTPGYEMISWEMISWVDRYIPPGHRMRSGLDYVLVSYYEDQNAGHQLTQSELDTMFAALATRFTSANLGFGEQWSRVARPTGRCCSR